MRLHHLSVTAFGPFAQIATVDFDALSSGGLFLLTGATGAGKTSILDAVCFALYGQVPGDRSGAKHLRSDHAAPHVAPEVVLRCSIGERQLCFTRSPAWMRPKLRGTGETKVQAHVLVEELRDGIWTVLTNRLDDAGLLVTDLLGMSCTQFTQVAMLPQGRFQAFLRATSAERHAVLQQLFRTDRFERVEHWLVERRVSARRASEAASEDVRAIVNRLREATGSDDDLPWSADLTDAAETGVLGRWVEEQTTAAEEASRTAAMRSEAADRAQGDAAAALAAGTRTDELCRRGTRGRTDLARWEARTEELTALRAQLADHHRAAPLSALARGAEQARRTAEAAAEQVPAGADRAHLTDQLEHARYAAAQAEAFVDRAQDRDAAVATLTALRADLQELEAGIAETELRLSEQPALIADAVAAVHEARAAAVRHPVVVAAVERLQEATTAARRAELVGLELAAARTDVLAATDAAQAAKEIYLDLREARINGMAAELAGQLASGCSCPVCGSADHPSPARAKASAVGRPEEDLARKALDDAEFELQARQVAVATLEGELRRLDDQLGDTDRSTLPGALEEARDEAERLEPLVAALDVLVAREGTCRAVLAEASEQHRAALLRRAELRAQADQLEAVVVTVDEAWAALLAIPGTASDEDSTAGLDALIAARRGRVAALEAALRALDTAEQAQVVAAQRAAEVAQAAAEAGFGDVRPALAALLTPDEVNRISTVLDEADGAHRAALLILADPDVAAALEGPVPDLSGLRSAHDVASLDAKRALTELAAAQARRHRLASLTAQLGERLADWEPLRSDYRTVAGLAALVEGKSLDNPQRMRLAAYVLAEQLRQVVAAANERLAGMTDQRYALEHTEDRGFGEQRGGLSLRVRDDWSGVQRDPATLSGGETFVVSLALALGLADTVAHEAGGTDIDTLFIDEGFGSLDADTLEDVMDTLDSLRDGGRVVGLVSHVPELRSRITTQLEVTKGRSGSTVRAAVSVG